MEYSASCGRAADRAERRALAQLIEQRRIERARIEDRFETAAARS
jgi:hypothetical protein